MGWSSNSRSSIEDRHPGDEGFASEGDLTQTIDKSYQGAFADLKEYANDTVLKLSAIITEVNLAADCAAAQPAGQGITFVVTALSQRPASRPRE